MEEKLYEELLGMAHNLLQIKEKDNVAILKKHAKLVYEKLAILDFLQEQARRYPTDVKIQEEYQELLAPIADDTHANSTTTLPVDSKTNHEETIDLEVEKQEEVKIQEEDQALSASVTHDNDTPHDTVSSVDLKNSHEEMIDLEVEKQEPLEEKQGSSKFLETELQNITPIEEGLKLFDQSEPQEIKTPPVNLFSTNAMPSLREPIRIELNDRIAFVRHLFDQKMESFIEVCEEIRQFEDFASAKKMIRKKYGTKNNWKEHLEQSDKFYALLERYFSSDH